jgi:Na+-translocating ferredoxin:NAD+ oxidoreductase RnfG subunit
MIQGPEAEIAKQAAEGILTGNPIIILGVIAALGLALAALMVSMVKQREKGLLKLQEEREAAWQENMRRTADSTAEIAKCAAVQTSLLGQIHSTSQQTAAQMAAWSSPEWLRDKIDSIHDDVKKLL